MPLCMVRQTILAENGVECSHPMKWKLNFYADAKMSEYHSCQHDIQCVFWLDHPGLTQPISGSMQLKRFDEPIELEWDGKWEVRRSTDHEEPVIIRQTIAGWGNRYVAHEGLRGTCTQIGICYAAIDFPDENEARKFIESMMGYRAYRSALSESGYFVRVFSDDEVLSIELSRLTVNGKDINSKLLAGYVYGIVADK